MLADKGKKPKVQEMAGVADSDDIDDDHFLSFEKLQEVQDELEKINKEAGDKVLEVEQKYNEIRRLVYVKRNEMIKTIPDFWLIAFLCHPALCDLLSEEDQKMFKYIDSIDVEDFKDGKSSQDEGATKITGMEIKWKEGKAASNGVDHVKKGNKRPLAEESFFSWFSETQQKDITELHEEIAEITKEDLWPNPLKCLKMENDDDGEDINEEDS